MKKILLMLLVLMISCSLLLAACGGAPAQPETDSDYADDAGDEYEDEYEEDAYEDGDDDADSTGSAMDEEVAALKKMFHSSWTGNSDNGNEVIYLLGDKFGALGFINDDNETLSFVGPVSFEGSVGTIVDQFNGLTVVFNVEPSDDGLGHFLNMGDLAQVYIENSDLDETLEAFVTMFFTGTMVG